MTMTMQTDKRRFLFIHQNFPGQFVHLSAALARNGNEVVALGIAGRPVPGVRYVRYQLALPKVSSSMPLVKDFEAKVTRGMACAAAMLRLQAEGFEPDVIVAHPGWGEALFCKDVWPNSKLVVFAEFFYNTQGADVGFDAEFLDDSATQRSRLRMKNTAMLHALLACDVAYTPTQWQWGQLPKAFQNKVSVIFDGIDTDLVQPDSSASLFINDCNLTLTANDEVITFVNRNLEPYRGFHRFMRALPAILNERPLAHCVIVGGDDISYGVQPQQGGSWRDVLLQELGDKLPMDRVHFVGRLTYADYLKVLQISSCHVYLTYPFVLSWSCVEAMSAGCTLVASDTGPVQELIKHGSTGLLVDFFDTAGLARQVVKVLQTPEEFQQLGQAGRAAAVARYDLMRFCLPEQLAMMEKLLVGVAVTKLEVSASSLGSLPHNG